MKLFDLEGRVAIVTGATGLIGTNHCKALAEAGATIIIADLDIARCETVKKSLKNSEKHDTISFDITDEEEVKIACKSIIEKFHHIDILVNNAAINDMFENPALAGEQSMFENYPVKMFRASLEANITGTFLCCQVFGAEMAKAGKGSIINIASTYGMVGPDQSIYKDKEGKQLFYKSAAYPATKGAVINFTRFFAAYWGHKGVRVNTLSPGGVENAQDDFFVQNYSAKTPLHRMAKPTDYQGAIVFLASDASDYMTGANLVVDGGWTAI